MDEKCTWPGCDEPGLCQSGNFGNQIVCAGHFTRTNGETGEEARAQIKRDLVAWLDAAPLDSTKARYDGVEDVYVKIRSLRAALEDIL